MSIKGIVHIKMKILTVYTALSGTKPFFLSLKKTNTTEVFNWRKKLKGQ